ncbi:complement C1q tumor necrosis factor-related protein 2 isoform X2 [Eucyclogobius newberryi]|uniref:complement C1q tumor necrosis factor-related protein 2 isoform X2 n=1 Tax=Eucyclogobius newberryi TaxID=166745 RepID=UPI003B58E9ED
MMAWSQSGLVGPGGVPGGPGSSGTVGPMGRPGEDGPDGRDGGKGANGDRGESGRSGNQGKSGVKGRKGPFGKTGPSGLGGLHGAPGQIGKQGAKGEQGEEGDPGAPGGCKCGRPARSAFSVAVTQSSPKEHQPIHFRRILLNEGDHYNASTGKFVCVIPGVYYFSYDITIGNKHLAIGLVLNGQYKIRTLDTISGNHDVASGSTILHLQSSDQVWLQVYNSGHNGLFFDPFWTDSTFTGFLIYAEQDYLNEADREANAKESRS